MNWIGDLYASDRGVEDQEDIYSYPIGDSNT